MAELAIKKTMEAPVAYLEKIVGKPFTKEQFDAFVKEFALKTSRASSGPRESVKLFDKDGNVIGRRCSVFKLWLPASEFNGDVSKMSICREANKIKVANAREADKIAKEAEALLEQARTAATPQEKLKLYETYDKELAKATAIREQEIKVPEDYKAGFETAEELAKSLKTEVILENPVKEAAEKPSGTEGKKDENEEKGE